MYEDDWNDEDWWFMYGEVPVIIILRGDTTLAPARGKRCSTAWWCLGGTGLDTVLFRLRHSGPPKWSGSLGRRQDF